MRLHRLAAPAPPIALLLLCSTGALGADAVAQVNGADGEPLGTVEFTATASGHVHAVWRLEGIPEGVHGLHVHETGDCSAADFTSAGGHLAGDRKHGVLVADGPHPGDFPNAHVGADGTLIVEHFNELLEIDGDGGAAMLDADGAAVIVHSGPDDYRSQPAGEAGSRIACGVVERSGG